MAASGRRPRILGGSSSARSVLRGDRRRAAGVGERAPRCARARQRTGHARHGHRCVAPDCVVDGRLALGDIWASTGNRGIWNDTDRGHVGSELSIRALVARTMTITTRSSRIAGVLCLIVAAAAAAVALRPSKAVVTATEPPPARLQMPPPSPYVMFATMVTDTFQNVATAPLD